MGKILITGADGYLGLGLARRYLESTDEPLLLWVRAADQEEFEGKKEKLRHQLNNDSSRVSCIWGDLRNEDPFDAVDSKEVGKIIHTAAVTRFNVDEETARKVNVEGTEKLFWFAESCPSLVAVGLLSTIYSSGLQSGVIEEIPIDGKAGFANHYESSKWAAEAQLLTRFDHLPWRIFRIATVIADTDEGYVGQLNVLHNTLKMFYYGLLSLIPGKPGTPLYFVTRDFATDAVFALMNHPSNQSIYHVAHAQEDSILLGELIDLAFDVFGQQKDFKSTQILKPLFCDEESFALLVEGVRSLGAGVVNQAISSVAPFASQLYISKEVRNQKLVSAFDDYHAPDVRQLIRNTFGYLVRSKWGRESAQHV